MSDAESAPSDAQVKRFTYLSPMLDSALFEMREFAKKKQDGIISKTKTRLLNRLLTDVQGVLQGEASITYLENLSEEELPQNSDAVLILGQYRAALDSFKERNYRWVSGGKAWITKEWIEENEGQLEEDDDGVDDDDEEEDEGDDGQDEEEIGTEEDKS